MTQFEVATTPEDDTTVRDRQLKEKRDTVRATFFKGYDYYTVGRLFFKGYKFREFRDFFEDS